MKRPLENKHRLGQVSPQRFYIHQSNLSDIIRKLIQSLYETK
jgi:hypothetical protein